MQLTVADNGTLACVADTGRAGDNLELARVDTQGRREPAFVDPHNYSDLRLSPDGRRLAVHLFEGENDIWVIDLVRGDSTRITFDPAEDETPLWSPAR